MINDTTIQNLKPIKCKNVLIVNPFFIIGDNEDDCILKTMTVNNTSLSFPVSSKGIDINAYNKCKTDRIDPKTCLKLWFKSSIADRLTNKLNSINEIKSNSTKVDNKLLDRSVDTHFYQILSNSTKSGGDFVNIFGDGKLLFVFPSLFKIRKTEELSVNRYSTDRNIDLYEFILENKNFIINTYVLALSTI